MSTHVAKDYIPTIIDSRPLLPRLAAELSLLQQECKLAWPEFKKQPVPLTLQVFRVGLRRGRRVLFAPNVLAALLSVAFLVAIVLVAERTLPKRDQGSEEKQLPGSDVAIINLHELDKKPDDGSIGRGGNARVGFRKNSGEGSGEVRRRAQGGGGGGDHEPLPQQVGKLPPPSNILASIPKAPPINPPSLPVAGMDIDPALWKDLKAPVFGDPRSTSTESSKGPGNGEGMGTNDGLGIGEGRGPGFGPGNKGNMGNGDKQIGCCGQSGGDGNSSSWDQRILTGKDVEQRARLLLKPEPQYTDEARRNQITGTVMLRVVFSNSGQVEQIRAVQTLPFGLTERAIAAARQIKFLPATKGGRAVSVYMQLEYNFNLY
jgi:TonB family protein